MRLGPGLGITVKGMNTRPPTPSPECLSRRPDGLCRLHRRGCPDRGLPPWLVKSGFAHVEVLDIDSDLNAYAKVKNQAACCSPPAAAVSGLAVVGGECCPVGPAAVVDEALHVRLADLLRRYDVNDYAASVKVFAVKPR